MERPESAGDAGAAQQSLNRLVVKNTFLLTASQAITIPLSILVNAAMARYLEAAEFGLIYLAATVCGFGFLAVNWGHEGVLPALISQQRSRAGTLLVTSIVWRLGAACVVYVILGLGSMLLGYDAKFQWILALSCLGAVCNSLLSAGKETVRGFERADIPSYMHVGQQFLTALLVIPVLLVGGRTQSVLAVQALASIVVVALAWKAIRSLNLGQLSFRATEFKSLFVGGAPFVFFGLAMALQPNVDAVFLSKMASAEVIGWYAVSRRLVGVLLFPAAALVSALYPTLCRLWLEDKDEFVRVSRGALQGVALLIAPVALGCALYPEIGIAIFSTKKFAPAEDNLRLQAGFLLMVYFSMPLGTCIVASGKQRLWSGVQALCVLVSLVLDPLLIPWFQRRTGNGGLGVSIASVASEVVVVGCGVALVPRGIFDRTFVKVILLALLSGAVMAGIARVLHPFLTPYLAAPLAVASYVGVLWLTGGIDKSHVEAARGFFQRKMSRAR